jgi:two-component system sensor histidine kinase UhpB
MTRDRRERAGREGQALAMALLVLAVCLGATYAFWHQVEGEAERARREAFEFRADETVAHIETRLKRLEQVLRGATGLAAATGIVTRDGFHAYVEALRLESMLPEIRGIGFAVAVDGAAREGHLARARAEGLSGYRIQPEGERHAYAPVLHREGPLEAAHSLVGFDMYTDPVLHAAMDRATHERTISMSAATRLRRSPEDAGRPGVVLFMAVAEKRAPSGAEKSPHDFSGWMFAQICMIEMMNALRSEDINDYRGIGVRIDDGSTLSGGAPLFGTNDPEARDSQREGRMTAVRRLDFAGHQWLVRADAPPDFHTEREDEHPLMLTAAGVACSVLLASLTWLLATGRVRARRTAARMNEDLVRSESRLRDLNEDLEHRVSDRTRDVEAVAERLRLAVETSKTGLWDWDLATQTVHYSPEWTSQIGLEPGELDGTIGEWENRLHPEDREEAIRLLHEVMANPGTPREMEFRLRHRDGTYRTILARKQAFADASGKAVRVVGSHLDITDRKRAEDSLRQLTRELREVGRELSRVEEADRRWLASELHDSIGASLTALNLNLTIIRDRLPEEARPALEPRLNDSIGLLDETVEAVRGLMAQLRPPVLDDYGLATSLRWYVDQIAARADLKATFRLSGEDVRFSPEMEIALFRIAQGALANVVKHAHAKQVAVSMDVAPDRLAIVIADDGRGFDIGEAQGEQARPHWGLVTMRERAEAIGGRLAIESSPGEGTRVVVEVPR